MADDKIKRDHGGQVVFKAAADGVGEIEGFASFKSVDRYGELVLPSAFASTIAQFLLNPILCLGHDSSGQPYSGLADGGGLPIGSCSSLSIVDLGLKFVATFADTPVAQMVRGLYKDGHMRAFSIGFWVKQNGWRDPTAEELATYGASLKRVITDIELAEISCVPLPANREALALVVRSFGVSPTGQTADTIQTRNFLEAILRGMPAPPVPVASKASPEQTAKMTALAAAYQSWTEQHTALGVSLAGLEKLIEAGTDPKETVEKLAADLAEAGGKGKAFEDQLKSFSETQKDAGPTEDWSRVLQALNSNPVKL